MKTLGVIVAMLVFVTLFPHIVSASDETEHPQLIVNVALPEVAIFGTQTITVSSVSNNSTPIVPSPGPLSIRISNSNGEALGLGCDRCNLTNGTYVLAFDVKENFGFGTNNVLVHDFSTNLTAFAHFTVVLSAAYINYVIQNRTAELNRVAQEKVDQAVAANNATAQELFGAMTITWLVAILAAQHRLARRKGLMSLVDKFVEIFKMQRGQSTTDLLFRGDWAPYISKEQKRDRVRSRRALELAGMKKLLEDLERWTATYKEEIDLAKFVKQARVIAGLPEKSSFDTWKPGARS